MTYVIMIKKLWNRIFKDTWNIAVCEMGKDLCPANIRWMKHDYSDRWFADPFFLDETPNTFVILAEEYLEKYHRGRICKLIVEKSDCRLVQNETLLDLSTHLSFPNIFVREGKTYIFPENSASGQLVFYCMNELGMVKQSSLEIPLIDPVLFQTDDSGLFLLGTLPEDANGNILHVFTSSRGNARFEEVQQISFKDNVARRAGSIFEWNGKRISPAQVCNKHYGEGISFQEIQRDESGLLTLREIQRLKAKRVTKMTGFHTYNLLGDNVVIDGYRYGNEFIHDFYFKLRGLKYM